MDQSNNSATTATRSHVRRRHQSMDLITHHDPTRADRDWVWTTPGPLGQGDSGMSTILQRHNKDWRETPRAEVTRVCPPVRHLLMGSASMLNVSGRSQRHAGADRANRFASVDKTHIPSLKAYGQQGCLRNAVDTGA